MVTHEHLRQSQHKAVILGQRHEAQSDKAILLKEGARCLGKQIHAVITLGNVSADTGAEIWRHATPQGDVFI